MKTQGEAKTGGDQLPVPALPSSSSRSQADDPAKTPILHNGSNDEAVAIQSTGTENSIIPPMKNFDSDPGDYLVKEMNSTLDYLEYLNSESSLTVFSALEKLAGVFAEALEDFSRIEGLLARKNFELADLKRMDSVLSKYAGMTARARPILDMVYNFENAITNATILTRPRYILVDQKPKDVEGEEEEFFPVILRCIAIFKEVSRRLTVWNVEIRRRFDSMEKGPVQ